MKSNKYKVCCKTCIWQYLDKPHTCYKYPLGGKPLEFECLHYAPKSEDKSKEMI